MTKETFPVQTVRTWSALVLLALAGCGGVAREPAGAPDGGAIPPPDGGEPMDGGSARNCGGTAGTTCSVGEYCSYSIDQACGAGDATGVCVPRPAECVLTFPYRPVCGCDGNTHSDACSAAACGVSVMSEGACPGDRTMPCRDGEIKRVDCNTCTCIGGLWGCTIVGCPPCAPPATRKGVGGWDECVCNSNEQWACTGARCPAPPRSKPCGERNPTCDANELCDYPEQPTCTRSGAMGFCTPRPDACSSTSNAPVCGCNLRDYPNACEAARAGTGLFGPGKCPPPPAL